MTKRQIESKLKRIKQLSLLSTKLERVIMDASKVMGGSGIDQLLGQALDYIYSETGELEFEIEEAEDLRIMAINRKNHPEAK